MQCKLCNAHIPVSHANKHLRMHSVQDYKQLKLELSPENIRVLIRGKMDKECEILTEEVKKFNEIPRQFTTKLIFTGESNNEMSFKIVSGKSKELIQIKIEKIKPQVM